SRCWVAATNEVDPVSSAAPSHRPLQKKTLHLRRAARSLLLRAVVLPRRLSAAVQRPSPLPPLPAAVAFSAETLGPTSWAGGRALALAAPPSASRYIPPCIRVLVLLTASQPCWGETANTYHCYLI
ncbi:unnamed protein product, partial [Ectocarpus sp. 12 AP-2014]